MNAQDLKNSILQLAIQGKLVEQRKEEGNTRELLEQIKVEKEQLIKEKKIKKMKPLSEIKEDEIPFEIPQTWNWLRLGNICGKIGSGSTPAGGNSVYKQNGIKFLRSQNIYNDGLRLENIAYISEEQNKQGSTVKAKDILLNITGGSIGRCALVPDDFDVANINQHVMIIRNLVPEIRYFLHYTLTSAYIQSMIMSVQVGVSREGLSAEKLNNFLIPLPPLEEQKRIVAKIEELMPYVEKYGDAHSKLEVFNKEFPGDVQKSILQYAIQGKLVEQRVEEGTAEALYQQIQEEKVKLINEGKLKKEKLLPAITEDEVPFEIPESWKWVRLGGVASKITDGSHNPPPNTESGYYVISAKNIKNEEITFDNVDRYTDEKGFLKENSRTNISRGDIILGIIGGSIGNIAIYEHDERVIAQRSIAIIDTLICNQYIKRVIQSPLIQIQLKSSSGTAQGGVYLGKLNKIIIPLPPLEEQKRIVTKINELMPLCQLLVK